MLDESLNEERDVKHFFLECPYCNNELPNEALFCEYCGKSLAALFKHDSDIRDIHPVRVLLKQKIYSLDCGGVVEIELQKDKLDNISKIEIGLQCSVFNDVHSLHTWLPGADNIFRFDFKPSAGGEFLVRLRLIQWNSSGSPNVFHANFSIFVSVAESPVTNNVNIGIGNNSGKFVNVDDMQVNIENSKMSSDPDLPSDFQKNQFCPLTLYWSDSDTRFLQKSFWTKTSVVSAPREQRSIVKANLFVYMPGDKRKAACLNVASSISFGRDHENSDIFCYVLANNEKFGTRSELISRRHCSIEIQNSGCVLVDHSTNGTKVGSESIRQGSIPVRSGAIISLAGVLCFRLREFRDISSLYKKLLSKKFNSSLDKLDFVESAFSAEDMAGLPLQCVRLDRIDDCRNMVEYFVLLEEMSIGRDSSCALVVPHESVEGVHASIRVENGGMTLIAFADVEVDGLRLERNESRPLSGGESIRFGEVRFEFQIGENS